MACGGGEVYHELLFRRNCTFLKKILLGLDDGDVERVGLTQELEVYPASPLCVVTPAQVGHTLHTLFVNVHVAS